MELEEEVKFSDDVDRASHLESVITGDAIDAIRKRAAPEQHPDFDGKHCVECDVLIPMKRLQLGKVRCVTCQEVLEYRAKTHRK